jgi:hypothetical protein
METEEEVRDMAREMIYIVRGLRKILGEESANSDSDPDTDDELELESSFFDSSPCEKRTFLKCSSDPESGEKCGVSESEVKMESGEKSEVIFSKKDFRIVNKFTYAIFHANTDFSQIMVRVDGPHMSEFKKLWLCAKSPIPIPKLTRRVENMLSECKWVFVYGEEQLQFFSQASKLPVIDFKPVYNEATCAIKDSSMCFLHGTFQTGCSIRDPIYLDMNRFSCLFLKYSSIVDLKLCRRVSRLETLRSHRALALHE